MAYMDHHLRGCKPLKGLCGLCGQPGIFSIWDDDLRAVVSNSCAALLATATEDLLEAGMVPPAIELVQRHQRMRRSSQ